MALHSLMVLIRRQESARSLDYKLCLVACCTGWAKNYKFKHCNVANVQHTVTWLTSKCSSDSGDLKHLCIK